MVDYKLNLQPGRLWTPGPDGLVVVPLDLARSYVPGYGDIKPGQRVLLNPQTQECTVQSASGAVLYRGPQP